MLVLIGYRMMCGFPKKYEPFNLWHPNVVYLQCRTDKCHRLSEIFFKAFSTKQIYAVLQLHVCNIYTHQIILLLYIIPVYAVKYSQYDSLV